MSFYPTLFAQQLRERNIEIDNQRERVKEREREREIEGERSVKRERESVERGKEEHWTLTYERGEERERGP